MTQAMFDEFSDDEQRFSGQLLETIFYHRKMNLDSFTASELDIIATLIQSFSAHDAKYHIFHCLSSSTRREVICRLPDSDQVDFFMYWDDTKQLTQIFSDMDIHHQKVVLENVYAQRKDIYSRLKPLVNDRLSMVNGIMIEKEHVLGAIMDREIQSVLTMVDDESSSLTSMSHYAQHLLDTYDIEDVDVFGKTLIVTFVRQRIPLRNKASFLKYLKLAHVLAPMDASITFDNRPYYVLVDRICIGLMGLPDVSWVIRVLNQFPVPMIRDVIRISASYERIASFEKRNLYCKLYTMIKKNMAAKNTDRIRLAFGQL